MFYDATNVRQFTHNSLLKPKMKATHQTIECQLHTKGKRFL